jgi:hypothetical protein
VVGCECVALWPTLREAWRQPELECLASWAADLVGSLLCVFALAHLTLAAVLFPVYLVAASAAVVAVLLVRRRAIGAPPPAHPAPVPDIKVFPAYELGPYDTLRDGGAVVRAQVRVAESSAAQVLTGRTAPAHAGARARPSPPPA